MGLAKLLRHADTAEARRARQSEQDHGAAALQNLALTKAATSGTMYANGEALLGHDLLDDTEYTALALKIPTQERMRSPAYQSKTRPGTRHKESKGKQRQTGARKRSG
jgi:hypothetical protein